MKKRNGSVFRKKSNGKWFARVVFIDATGKRRDLQRGAESKAHAREVLQRLLVEIEATDGRSVETEKKTFADLVDYFRAHYATPAEYVDGRKTSGYRSLDTMLRQLTMLRAYFGGRRVRSVTYGDLRTFKSARLKEPRRHGGQRTIATVNRELALLRRLFQVAYRESWIIRNPFEQGEPLISPAGERQRERILTREEEVRLLRACDHPSRHHLKPILICALDTGMRQGEIFKLRWRDIDLDQRLITVQAFNTKTMRERQVALTFRLFGELQRLWDRLPGDKDLLVFGVTDNVKRSFDRVRSQAGIPDLRFHDLRHTAATRLTAGLPLPEVGRILGHSQPRTTYRYVNATTETAQRAAAILDLFNQEDAPMQDAIN